MMTSMKKMILAAALADVAVCEKKTGPQGPPPPLSLGQIVGRLQELKENLQAASEIDELMNEATNAVNGTDKPFLLNSLSQSTKYSMEDLSLGKVSQCKERCKSSLLNDIKREMCMGVCLNGLLSPSIRVATGLRKLQDISTRDKNKDATSKEDAKSKAALQAGQSHGGHFQLNDQTSNRIGGEVVDAEDESSEIQLGLVDTFFRYFRALCQAATKNLLTV